MKVFKRILATVLTFAVAFMLLGGIGGALAAVPALANAEVTLTDKNAHSLAGYLTTASITTVTWTVPANEYLTYNEENKTITAVKNTPVGVTVDIEVADTATPADKATLKVKVNLPAAPAPATKAVTLRDRTQKTLNDYLDSHENVTWSCADPNVTTYLEFNASTGTITAKANTTSAIDFTATNASGTATVSVSVGIPSLAFTTDAITLKKGDVLDMATKLSTAIPNATDVTWTSVNTAVGSFGTAGTFTAKAAGTTLVRATSTLNTGVWVEKEVTVVAPTIALTASAKTITKLNEKSTLTATVSNLNAQVANGTVINWSSDNAAVKVDTSATTIANGVATVTVTGVSNGAATITAKAAGDDTVLATIKIGVGTELTLDLTGPNLDKSNRYGTYTVKLLDAAGNVVDNDTSKVHWDWSSSYLTMANDDLNDNRAKMHNGEAHIKMYARANTGSKGTRLYVWLDDESDDKVYHTITITGVSTLPQSGQDFTLVYVLGGLSVALLAAAGVWYGIRKKNNAKA